MKNMKLTFEWVFPCVKQVNMGSSANIRWGFWNVSLFLPKGTWGYCWSKAQDSSCGTVMKQNLIHFITYLIH